MARGRKTQARGDERTRNPSDREAPEVERLRRENDRLRQLLEEYAKRIADLAINSPIWDSELQVRRVESVYERMISAQTPRIQT